MPENPRINLGKDVSTWIRTLVGSVPLDRPTIGLQAHSRLQLLLTPLPHYNSM
jgi:hypothetical protein